MRILGLLRASVIGLFSVGVWTLSGGCTDGQSNVLNVSADSDYAAPRKVGTIQTEDVKESSGLAVSRCQPDVLWTHNDAGKDAIIYALSPDGRHLGTWRVQGAENLDWEDAATVKDPGGKCFLLIGDIGDNDKARTELTVYRFAEPAITPEAANSNAKAPLQTEPAQAMRFSYADAKNNAEALLAHPQTGDLYILTKENKGPSAVYKVRAAWGSASPAKAEKLTEISFPGDPPGRLTGGAISPDGRRVIVTDIKNGYELKLPDGSADVDAIWKQTPTIINLGDRPQGEAVSYNADGTAIYASSEKKNAPLFLIQRK